jgi:hypothetical protein
MRTASALALCLLLTACGLGGPTASATPVAVATGPPTQAASAARITPPTVTPPTPPGTNLPAFKCADTGGGVVGNASVTAARISQQVGYDRFVLQFDTKVPTYTVKRQAKPIFKTGASGQSVSLTGSVGVLVLVHSATESGTFTGPTDFTHSDFAILNEARLVEDFEGYVSWGLGLSKSACLRTFTLSNPARLVVDFTTS